MNVWDVNLFWPVLTSSKRDANGATVYLILAFELKAVPSLRGVGRGASEFGEPRLFNLNNRAQ